MRLFTIHIAMMLMSLTFPSNSKANSDITVSGLVMQSTFSRGQAMSQVRNVVKHDVYRGGLLKDVAIVSGLHIYDTMSHGGSFKEGLEEAGHYLTKPSFIVGDLGGALVGAALGAMVPVPAGSSLACKLLRTFFPMAGAMLLATIAAEVIHLQQDGHLSLHNLIGAINFSQLSGQIIGATIGSVICPIPLIGTIIGGLTGAIAGKHLGDKLSHTNDRTGHPKGKVKISIIDSPNNDSSQNVQKLQMSATSAYERLIKSSDPKEQRLALRLYEQAKASLQEARAHILRE